MFFVFTTYYEYFGSIFVVVVCMCFFLCSMLAAVQWHQSGRTYSIQSGAQELEMIYIFGQHGGCDHAQIVRTHAIKFLIFFPIMIRMATMSLTVP